MAFHIRHPKPLQRQVTPGQETEKLTSDDEAEIRPKKRRAPNRMSTFSLLQQQVEMQEEFHLAVKESLKENVDALRELVNLKKTRT